MLPAASKYLPRLGFSKGHPEKSLWAFHEETIECISGCYRNWDFFPLTQYSGPVFPERGRWEVSPISLKMLQIATSSLNEVLPRNTILILPKWQTPGCTCSGGWRTHLPGLLLLQPILPASAIPWAWRDPVVLAASTLCWLTEHSIASACLPPPVSPQRDCKLSGHNPSVVY